MVAPKLAIDFGTSRTKVAYYDESAGTSQLVELGEEIRTVLPSIFYIPKEGQGERLVGDEAKKMVDRDPEGIVLSLKKEIHKMGKKRCGPDRPAIDRIQLAADLFRYIHNRCRTEVFHDEDLYACRLTVPSDFKAQQREAIRSAAQLGGFREVEIVEEPVAAAKAWLLNHAGEKFGNNVVVCDVGGGTTDFAFLKFTDGRFEADEKVLSDGFQQGGNDVDELIWEKLCENNSANEEMQSFRAGFLLKICQGRELISRIKKSETPISVNGYQYVLSRTVTEEATAEFVKRVKVEIQRFLEKIRNQVKADNAPILLVGGASKLPGLSDALRSLNFGNVYLWNDSDYATVLGAVEIPTVRPGKPISLPNMAPPCAESAFDHETIHTLVGDGRCDEAFEIVSQHMIKNSNPDLFALWIECGITVADANKVLATAREICRKRNKDLWGICCLADALITIGRHNEAEELIRPFSTIEESSTYQLLWIRYCLKYDIKLLEELLALKPNEPVLLASKSLIIFFGARSQEADAKEGNVAGKCLASALTKNPHSVAAIFAKLVAELELGFFTSKDDFETDLRRMERISPNNFLTSYVSGWYNLKGLQDVRSAIARFDKAINDPRSNNSKELTGLIFLGRTECYLELKDFQSARTDVNNCLRLIPNNPVALGIRGDLLVEEKRFEDAFKDYTQGLMGSPEYMVCLMGRAYCLAATSQFDEAAKCYEAAWRVDFSNQEAKESAVYCTISMIMNRLATPARNAYLRPHIPESKLKQAFQTYLSPKGLRDISKILLLYDDTFFGSAEDGFCLTSDELYWHNAWEADSHSIYYSTITSTTVSANNNLLVNCKKVECVSGGGADLWMHIIDALVQLHARIKSVQTAKTP